jgi:hypothetical protein
MTATATIETAAFLSTIDESKNPTFTHDLKEAIHWLATRHEYSHEYYRQIKRNTTRRKLEATLMLDHQTRVRIESAILAFLQNIHAACDAFPFALHIMLGGLTDDPDRDYPKWNKELLHKARNELPRAHELHAELEAFMADTNFNILAGLVNQAKHKYFPRVMKHADFVNDRYRLLMQNVEYFTYPNGKRTKCVVDELDVLEFVKRVHNMTLVKVFHLYIHAYNAVKK